MKTGDMMKFDLHVYVSIWVNFLPAARNRITRIFKKHLGLETMNIFIGSIGYIYIYKNIYIGCGPLPGFQSPPGLLHV